MKEILKFEYLGVRFDLLIDNGNLIYKKNENGEISSNLSKFELELINYILASLLPSKKIKDLGYINCGNKKISYLYDLETDLYIFHENKIITRDCLVLNSIFNNQLNYVSLKEKEEEQDLKFTRRNIKLGKIVIGVLVSSTVLLSSSLLWIKGSVKLIDWVNYYKANYKYQEEVLKYQDRKVELEEIIEAINNNPNLTLEEKEFFLSHPDFFLDNLEYFDYYTVIDNLKRLKIEYISNTKNRTYGEFVTNGHNRGLIKIYGATCFKYASPHALSHEFLHAFTKQSNKSNYFYEILNVVLNNEYFGESYDSYDNGYSNLRKYFYIISELVEPDVLRKYHASNDIDYLIDSLMRIIPDYDMALELFTNIDFICKVELLKETDPRSYLNLKDEQATKREAVLDSLKLYYEAKYQISIEDDLNVLFWFDNNSALNKIADNLNFDYNSKRCVDDYVRIKQFKKIFNKTGNDNLVLSICNSVREVIKNYTLEELLDGYFKSKDDITLPMNPDGTYIGVTYEPLNFIDYEVSSNQDRLKF